MYGDGLFSLNNYNSELAAAYSNESNSYQASPSYWGIFVCVEICRFEEDVCKYVYISNLIMFLFSNDFY